MIGGYLVEHLLSEGQTVVATDMLPSVDLPETAGYQALDINDAAQLDALLKAQRPDFIFHLAAQSFPPVSWEEPTRTYDVNVCGTLALFDAVRALDYAPTILLACSSGEYAVSTDGRPIAEDGLMGPSTPYAISKLVIDHLARNYAQRYDMRIIAVRPFFLVGPRKKGDVCSDFARGIVAIENGEQNMLLTGNLDVVRDFLDVRDGVRAFWTIARKGEAGTAYNICTGHGVSLRELLDIYRRLTNVTVRAEPDPARMRPVEEMVKIGDPSRLNALGWTPRYPLEQTLRDILTYWRGQLENAHF